VQKIRKKFIQSWIVYAVKVKKKTPKTKLAGKAIRKVSKVKFSI
jgi:hypothetical protein